MTTLCKAIAAFAQALVPDKVVDDWFARRAAGKRIGCNAQADDCYDTAKMLLERYEIRERRL